MLQRALQTIKETLRSIDAVFARFGSAIVLGMSNHTKISRPDSQPQKLLVDCTYIYSTNINTGIQRVVRKIVKHLDIHAQNKGIELVVVALVNGSFIRLNKEQITTFRRTPKWLNILQRVERKVRLYLASFFTAEKLYEEDILLMLDSSWHLHVWPSIAFAKSKGLHIFGVAYDLIPLTHPQFCDDTLEQYFRAWYLRSLNFFDGYFAISQTVKNDLIDFFKANNTNISNYIFESFELGADFDTGIFSNSEIRPEIVKLFEVHPSIYLTVSTIEPRKNHRYIFEVFKQLWNSNIQAGWLIVGRVGWKTEALLEEIRQNGAYNKKIWIFNDMSDAELRYCYKHSKALLFPSFVEGYGLPIIEALQNGLPVLASDTPIHREVGKAMIDYFDIDKYDSLAQLIAKIESHQISLKFVESNRISLPTWDICAQELLGKIVILSQEKRASHV